MMNYAFLCNDNKHSQREAISVAYFNIRILLHQKVRKGCILHLNWKYQYELELSYL